MHKIFKLYIKWKLIALIKGQSIHYLKEKHNYLKRVDEWECKTYNSVGTCLTQEQFEERKKEQISWSYEQCRISIHKGEAVSEILKIVESL